MKKILPVFAATAALILGLTGCPTVNAGLEPLVDLSDAHLVGCATPQWDFSDDNKFTLNDDGTYSLEFTATGSDAFAITQDGSWAVQFRSLIDADSPATIGADGENYVISARDPGYGNNGKINGLVKGSKYKMTISPASSETINVSLVCTKSACDTLLTNGLVAMEFDGVDTYTATIEAVADNEPIYILNADKNKKYSANLESGAEPVALEEGDKITTNVVKGGIYTLTVKITKDGYEASLVGKIIKMTHIAGTITNWGFKELSEYVASEDNKSATATYTFVASGEKDEFAITDGTWDIKYTGASFEVGADTGFVKLVKGASDNASIEGLEDGTKYIITVKGDSDDVYFKVEKAIED